MKIVRYNSSLAQQWNEFVLANDTATPYHFTYWLDAIEGAYGHKNISQCGLDETGNIVALMPLCQFITLKQQKIYSSLPFCDVGGAIGSETNYAQQITNVAKQESMHQSFELRQRGDAIAEHELKDLSGTNIKVSMIMPLGLSADNLLDSFKPKLRSQIKKATKNGLTANLVHDDSLIDDFYQVMSHNMRDLGSPVHSRLFFQKIMQNYAQHAATAVVYKNETPCAAGLVLKTQTKGCIPWASSLREFNKLAPNMLLYWTLMAHLADDGIEEFDLGRSTIDEGTYRFKKQWGAKPVTLHWENSKENKTDRPVTTSKARTIVESVWRRLPLSTTTMLGPLIRKHISL